MCRPLRLPQIFERKDPLDAQVSQVRRRERRRSQAETLSRIQRGSCAVGLSPSRTEVLREWEATKNEPRQARSLTAHKRTAPDATELAQVHTFPGVSCRPDLRPGLSRAPRICREIGH